MKRVNLTKLGGALLLGGLLTLAACSSHPTAPDATSDAASTSTVEPKSFNSEGTTIVSGTIAQLNERTGELVLVEKELRIKATDDIVVILSNQTKPNGLGALIAGDIVDVFGAHFGDLFLANQIVVRKHALGEQEKSLR